MTQRRGIVLAAFVLLSLVVIGTGAWGALALAYCAPFADPATTLLGASFFIASLVAILALRSRRWRWAALAAYGLMFALLVGWWRGIEPSNDRDWNDDVAVLSDAMVQGDQVSVHNIRNFAYRTEFEYVPARYDRVFDLAKLVGVDLVAVYWMGPAIAHTFLSFEFADGEHLAVSIETRKKKGDSYSTLRGFFRQYELYYVVADERDVIRLRTNYRHDPPEQVYVYRMSGDIENGRRVFLEYVKKINALTVRPEFYNTLTTNCTTDIWSNSLVNADHLPLNWKILLSGYVPQYLYEAGRLDTSVPFTVLMERTHVNARALAADASPDFSRLIRVASDAAK